MTSLSDFALSLGGNYEFEKIGTSEYSVLKWASIRPREFDIPAGTSQQVQLTIAMPSDDKLSGEYAGVVFFQTRPERHGGGVAFSARVASKFYITVPNTVQVNGAITKMSSAKGANRQIYRVLFKNVGNAHEYLRGQVTVQKKDGTVVYQVPMPDNMLVERGGERLIELSGKTLGARHVSGDRDDRLRRQNGNGRRDQLRRPLTGKVNTGSVLDTAMRRYLQGILGAIFAGMASIAILSPAGAATATGTVNVQWHALPIIHFNLFPNYCGGLRLGDRDVRHAAGADSMAPARPA